MDVLNYEGKTMQINSTLNSIRELRDLGLPTSIETKAELPKSVPKIEEPKEEEGIFDFFTHIFDSGSSDDEEEAKEKVEEGEISKEPEESEELAPSEGIKIWPEALEALEEVIAGDIEPEPEA